MKKILLVLFVLLYFSGCGFSPIYKLSDNESIIENYSYEITNKVSREIINEVDASLINNIESEYTLYLDIRENLIPLIVNTDGTIGKYQIEITFDFKLVGEDNEKLLYEGTSRGFTQYELEASEINNQEKKRSMVKMATKNAIQIMTTKLQGWMSQVNDY